MWRSGWCPCVSATAPAATTQSRAAWKFRAVKVRLSAEPSLVRRHDGHSWVLRRFSKCLGGSFVGLPPFEVHGAQDMVMSGSGTGEISFSSSGALALWTSPAGASCRTRFFCGKFLAVSAMCTRKWSYACMLFVVNIVSPISDRIYL